MGTRVPVAADNLLWTSGSGGSHLGATRMNDIPGATELLDATRKMMTFSAV
jgi:hypothetical protein